MKALISSYLNRNIVEFRAARGPDRTTSIRNLNRNIVEFRVPCGGNS